MKKLLCVVLFMLSLLPCAAFGKEENPAARGRTAEMKRMSVFLSNFDIRKSNDADDDVLHLGDPANMGELIQFGIWHNYLNNVSLIKRANLKLNGITYDSAVSGKAVAASVRKYFDLPLKHGDSVTREGETYPYRNGMYYFRIADGVPNYAHVMEVSKKGNVITMRGEVYSAGVYPVNA